LNVGIIGAGALGLGTAYFLSKKGINSTIFENKDYLGGLGAAFQIENTTIEKYHHFVCSGDRVIQEIAKDKNINAEVLWSECSTGFYADGKLYPFTTSKDLLNFKPLSFIDRIRFGFGMLYLQRFRDWKKLESISAEKWLIKWTGSKAYDKIWGHLFNSKFEGEEDTIPLSWLHARISRRASSREKFGYVKNSMFEIFDSIAEYIKKNGSQIYLDTPVIKIKKIEGDKFEVQTKDRKFIFDSIVATVANPVFSEIVEELPQKYKKDLAKIRYQTIKNVVFVLDRPFSKYFWVNMSDRDIPFPGIIEMTNLIPREHFSGRSVIFLPNYLLKTNRLFKLNDEDLNAEYIEALKKIKGDNNFEEKFIIKAYTFWDDYADPYYTLNYSSILPDHVTPIDGLFLFNTSQIYPTTRNVNSSLGLGELASTYVEKYIES
jgi:protoporphyrinogen oxidase